MLINYSFRNFRSFSAPAEFDMTANGGKVLRRFPDNYIAHPSGYELLKTAVMVGENAGGKSNFIYSLQFLKSLFQENSAVKALAQNLNSNSADRTEGFSIEFIGSDQLVYRYELEIDETRILHEKLSFRTEKGKREQVVFSVEWNTGGGYEYDLPSTGETVKKALKNNAGAIGLFVAKLALLGDEHAIRTVDWMNNKLFPQSLTEGGRFAGKDTERELQILRDPRYLEVFRMVDYSISGIQVDEEQPYTKTLIERKRPDGSIMTRELQQDSTGVKEFFVWAIQIFRVVYENKVVFADEMDRVLNPVLSERVIAFINGKNHQGQFVFSTHNVLHLDLRTYMKEQIYFVTKARDSLNSELYSLSDFPEVRYETTKIYEFYMKGILGGTAIE